VARLGLASHAGAPDPARRSGDSTVGSGDEVGPAFDVVACARGRLVSIGSGTLGWSSAASRPFAMVRVR
jgi:hypothetical protein